jgi:small subunit ribosomal protein S20
VREAVTSKDPAAAAAELKIAVKELSKAASKGILHKNAASRRIGRLSKQVAALSRPS